MSQLLTDLTTGPNLIPSVLVMLVTFYWLMVIVGALDIELFDFDLSVDADVDVDPGMDVDASVDVDPGTFTGMGFATLRFLNIGQVPLMFWITAFTAGFSAAAYFLALYWDDPATFSSTWSLTQYTLRNAAIGVVVAKLATQPLRGAFRLRHGLRPEQMIGQPCEVTVETVSDADGQARFVTSEGAPRLLTVRCKKGRLVRGDAAVIVEYSPETKTFWIEQQQPEV